MKLIMPKGDFAFRPASMDIHTILGVMVENEYRLPNEFTKADVIYDLGANIGCFALMCLGRGAGHVTCYEPSKDNFRLLVWNLSVYPSRYTAKNDAVALRKKRVYFHTDEMNTAMHRIVDRSSKHTQKITTVPIDEVLPDHPFRMVKLDVEGSEWEILFESKRLAHAQEILVECHLALPARGYSCSIANVTAHLERMGFEVDSWINTPFDIPNPNHILRAVSRRHLNGNHERTIGERRRPASVHR